MSFIPVFPSPPKAPVPVPPILCTVRHDTPFQVHRFLCKILHKTESILFFFLGNLLIAFWWSRNSALFLFTVCHEYYYIGQRFLHKIQNKKHLWLYFIRYLFITSRNRYPTYSRSVWCIYKTIRCDISEKDTEHKTCLCYPSLSDNSFPTLRRSCVCLFTLAYNLP